METASNIRYNDAVESDCYSSDDADLKSKRCYNEADLSSASSLTPSLITFPSSGREKTLRHSEVSDITSEKPTRHYHVAKKQTLSRTDDESRSKPFFITKTDKEIIGKSLKDADFPLADVNAEKTTASQAVAFVIRASRRGVVSLCAEVAEILKEKERLEALVEEQKEEILHLMQNQVIPRSPSPPLPETADFGLQTMQEMCCQTIQLEETSIQTENILLPCAQVKSLEENEKIITDPTHIPGIQFQCGSDYTVQCVCPTMMTSSTQNPVLVTIGTNTAKPEKISSELGYHDHVRLEQRHKALLSKHKSLKNETKENVSKKHRLEADLAKAKQEIISLQKAIQDLQTKEYKRIQDEERLRMEETYSIDPQHDDAESNDMFSDDSNRKVDVIMTKRKSEKHFLPFKSTEARKSMRASFFPGPILGCKCQMCRSFFKSSGILGFACTPYVIDSSGRNPVLRDLRKLVVLQNTKLQVHPNDEVLVVGNKTGIVRYVGHLDGVGTPSVVYVGIELETPTGKNDGYLYGKRYFFSPQNHGLFLPLQDVLCVINKKLVLTEPLPRSPVPGDREHSIRKSMIPTRKLSEPKNNSPSSLSSSPTEAFSDDLKLPAVVTR